MRRPLSPALLAAALVAGPGCKDKDDSGLGDAIVEQTWMEGYRYQWVAANHRLSFLEVDVDGDQAHLALVGGTSTTNVGSNIECDLECRELVIADRSNLALHWARYTGSDASFGAGTAELVASSEPTQTDLQITMPAGASGPVTAFITGLRINTNTPVSGEPSCYLPAYGWHPTRLRAAVTDAVLAEGSDTVTATVEVAFEAGLSLEDIRACIDAVADRAQAQMQVDVLVVAGGSARAEQAVSHGMEWGWRDENDDLIEQTDPEYTSRPLSLGLSNPIAGWAELDYRFHKDEGLDRGAYLRELEWLIDVDAGVASGHAMNYSLTQLSGFDYAFSGAVVGVDVAGDIERGTLQVEGLPARLTDAEYAADPEIFTFDLQDGTVSGQ